MEPPISISIRRGKLESVCLLALLFITESFAISKRSRRTERERERERETFGARYKMKQRVSKCSLNKVGKSMINRLYAGYQRGASNCPPRYCNNNGRIVRSFFYFFVFFLLPTFPFLFPSATLSLFISLVPCNRNISLSLKITHDANAAGIIGRICSAR